MDQLTIAAYKYILSHNFANLTQDQRTTPRREYTYQMFVYPSAASQHLRVEHYSNLGVEGMFVDTGTTQESAGSLSWTELDNAALVHIRVLSPSTITKDGVLQEGAVWNYESPVSAILGRVVNWPAISAFNGTVLGALPCRAPTIRSVRRSIRKQLMSGKRSITSTEILFDLYNAHQIRKHDHSRKWNVILNNILRSMVQYGELTQSKHAYEVGTLLVAEHTHKTNPYLVALFGAAVGGILTLIIKLCYS